MNIIIAGATGYLGGMLVERLLPPPPRTVHNILLLVRGETKTPAVVKERKRIFTCNINDKDLQARIKEFSPDVIYCTTCCYETDTEYLYKTVDANYVFPARLLQIAAAVGTQKVRFISIGTSLPPELNLYSLTKKHFSELGEFFHRAGRLEFVNVLLESFYGAHEPANRFITGSILRLKANQDLMLTEGTQRRDYILIDDVIEVLYFLLDCKETSLLAEAGYTVPIGTGIAPSIKEIILFLYNELHSSSNVQFGAVAMRKHEPSTRADISLLRRLGYAKPITYWQDGMRKVIRSIE